MTIRTPGSDGAGEFSGFSLSQVTWGYRDIFATTIDELFREGCLGPEREEVTRRFFGLMSGADQSCFDHVLRQFLGALKPENRWIMDLPGVFSDVVDLGGELANDGVSMGVRFFKALADGQMGDTPGAVRTCLSWTRSLRDASPEVAVAFLENHRRLTGRMSRAEIDRYLEVARRIDRNKPGAGAEFLRGELNSSEAYILEITQECRLQDVDGTLRRMFVALTGGDFEIANLGSLDSDDLLERGSTVVVVDGNLYLPERCRIADHRDDNRLWYVLCAVAASAMVLADSFAVVHGHSGYRTCLELAGRDWPRTSTFMIVEYTRVLRTAMRTWPGARRLILDGLAADLEPGGDSPWQLVLDAVESGNKDPLVNRIREAADSSVNCFDTAGSLNPKLVEEVVSRYPALASGAPRPVCFLSDFMYPMSFTSPSHKQLIADMRDAAGSRKREEDENATSQVREGPGEPDEASPEDALSVAAAYVYPEWDFQQNQYREDWCHVTVSRPDAQASAVPDARWSDGARRVRAMFERLKPELARKEKYLLDGDEVNTDGLLRHLVDRTREPGPSARFYEKPIIQHRDLAVMLLLDLSGSTGRNVDDSTSVIDIEKRAAVLLAEGLASLGDRFSIAGFSSNGRERCEYLVFKEFEEPWNEGSRSRLLAAGPRSSTRIGPALRHSGHVLSSVVARQRLVLLITDGKPLDQGYDPASRYAQFDVRTACEENRRMGISTVAISTEENSLPDMEIMFGRRRFVILPSVDRLPIILPQLYLRLTA